MFRPLGHHQKDNLVSMRGNALSYLVKQSTVSKTESKLKTVALIYSVPRHDETCRKQFRRGGVIKFCSSLVYRQRLCIGVDTFWSKIMNFIKLLHRWRAPQKIKLRKERSVEWNKNRRWSLRQSTNNTGEPITVSGTEMTYRVENYCIVVHNLYRPTSAAVKILPESDSND
jgi:hypothetical protein